MSTPIQSLVAALLLASVCRLCAAESLGPLDRLAGQPADISGSAYQYRADRKADDNPPESWLGLMQYASLPFDKKPDLDTPALKKVLCCSTSATLAQGWAFGEVRGPGAAEGRRSRG